MFISRGITSLPKDILRESFTWLDLYDLCRLIIAMYNHKCLRIMS